MSNLFLQNIEKEEVAEMLSNIKSILKGEDIDLESYSDYPYSVKNNYKKVSNY
tara:strand:+ start:364 stop:522 length:159 start_codon:yes stop_codon:yes gene_type:complete